MGLSELFDAAAEPLKRLNPADLKKLGTEKLSDLIEEEIGRSRKRVQELEQTYPSANTREIAQRLIDAKKNVATTVGGVSGVFGLVSLPADLLIMAWLQLVLLVDVATLYKVNLKSQSARDELLDLFGIANGIGPMQRSGPKLLGSLAGAVLQRGGLKTLGRAMPLVAAPLTAYLNNAHIQKVGEHALRFYDGLNKAHQKAKSRSPGAAGR